MAACPVCGFDPPTVSPSDAAAALRSFPRRYRALLLRPSNDEADDPVARRGRDGWSALDHGAWAAAAIEKMAGQVRTALVSDNPTIDLPSIDPPAPPAVTTVGAVLDRLTTVTTSLADEVDRTKGEPWARPAVTTEGQSITALDVVRHAVHEGVHHLRAAEKVLQEVIGRPVEVGDDEL